MKIKKERTFYCVTGAFASIIMIIFILAPLCYMFLNMDMESIRRVFEKESLGSVIGNSLLSSLLTTFFSLVIAYFLAICTERTSMPCKKLIRYLIVLPMLIASVSIGMGVVLLGGNNGIINNLLKVDGGNIYGLLGIVLGSIMYSVPVAYLMLVNVLRYEDGSPYDAAKVLGIPVINQFAKITFPYIKKPLIAVAFSVFTLSFTDYGIPLMVGGKYKTLPMVMYQEVIGQLDFGKGCVYGSMLLIPAIIAFLMDLMNQNNGNSAYVIKSFEPKKNILKDCFAFVGSSVISLTAILPILAFIILAFTKKYPTNMELTLDHFTRTMEMDGLKYLVNSVIIAICVSVIGTILGIMVAYLSARHKGKCTKLLHLLAMSTGAIPGIVLGLAYVLFFKESPIYGTIVILIAVNSIHFFASPYLMIYTSFSKINENLEAVASTFGINKFRFVIDILISSCKTTVFEMLSFFFVNSMMTISAVSFLANTSNKPIALMINQFEAQAQLEDAAVVSLLILLCNLLVKIIFERKIEKR